MIASIDTNALIYWLLDEFPEKTKRVEALIKKEGQLVVDDAVFYELIYFLEKVKKISRPLIRDSINTIFLDGAFFANEEIISEALDFYVEHPKLSFIDCYLAQKAKSLKEMTLFTFDNKLSNQHEFAKLI
jgi:predicted nucleic-acid-binding protein